MKVMDDRKIMHGFRPGAQGSGGCGRAKGDSTFAMQRTLVLYLEFVLHG
jgi:hypothetical protein